MNKKLTIAFSAIFITGLVMGLMVNIVATHRNPNVRIDVTISENHGGIHDTFFIGNVITDIGETWIRNLAGFANDSLNAWSISLSNDATPLQTWTKLPNEVTNNGFGRHTGTVTAWVNAGDSAFNVSYTFTATTGGSVLQCCGLQWNSTASSDNNLFAVAAFTQTTFTNIGDTAAFTWSITVDAN